MRSVPLSELSDAEKDRTILLLSAALKDLRKAVEEASEHSYRVKKALETWAQAHGPRLGFLERAWVRGPAAEASAARTAARNDRLWAEIELEAIPPKGGP